MSGECKKKSESGRKKIENVYKSNRRKNEIGKRKRKGARYV